MLDSARRGIRVPVLARWSLDFGIAATLAANVPHALDTVQSTLRLERGRGGPSFRSARSCLMTAWPRCWSSVLTIS